MRARNVRLAVACGVVAVLTNGPVFFAQLKLFGQGPDFDTAWARFWFRGAAVVGFVLLAHHLAVSRWAATKRRIAGLLAVAAFSMFALLSTLWSVAPDATLRRSLDYIGLACFGVWFGAALPRRDQLLAIASAFQVCVMASALVLILRVPGSLQEGNQRWRGIYTNSNSLGPVAALAAISVGAMALRCAGGRRLVCAALVTVDLVVLVFSRSVTAMVATVVACLLGWVLLKVHHRRGLGTSARVMAIVAGCGVGIAALAAAVLVPLAGHVLRGDSTVSHRTHIWSEVWQSVLVHPVRGWGFYAFWERFDLAAPLYWRVGLLFGSAHNTVLEVALGLGAVGVLLFGMILLLGGMSVVSRWWWSPSVATGWWVVLLGFLVLEGVTESFILWYSYHWPFFVAAATAPALFDEQRRPFATVIVRSQGRRPYGLSAALGSLREQDRRDFEVVVVAQGSRAHRRGVRGIARGFGDLDLRLMVCRRPGRSAPINCGLAAARGRYILFLDDDDIALPHWVSTFATAEQRGKPALLRAQAHVQRWTATDDGDPVEPVGPLTSPYPASFDLADHLLANRTPICAVALPRALLHGQGIRADERLPVLEDFDMLMRVVLALPAVDIEEFTSVVRQHDGVNSLSLHGADEWDVAYRSVMDGIRASAVSSVRRGVPL